MMTTRRLDSGSWLAQSLDIEQGETDMNKYQVQGEAMREVQSILADEAHPNF